MAAQRLIHHVAICCTCGARCEARNALAWAHNHSVRYGHDVELQLGYVVSPRSSAPVAQRTERPPSKR